MNYNDKYNEFDFIEAMEFIEDMEFMDLIMDDFEEKTKLMELMNWNTWLLNHII